MCIRIIDLIIEGSESIKTTPGEIPISVKMIFISVIVNLNSWFFHNYWYNLYDFWNLSYFLVKEFDFGIYFTIAALAKKLNFFFLYKLYKSSNLYIFILLIKQKKFLKYYFKFLLQNKKNFIIIAFVI